MLRVALMGAGRVAVIRARELRARTDAELVAVVASDPDRARAVADVPFFPDPASMLVSIKPDAVMVCSSNPLHAPQVRACLEAGVPVSVDYPLALDGTEAASLLELARSRNLLLHVEHIDLSSPWFRALLSELPKIGELVSIAWNDVSTRKRKDDRDWIFDRRHGFSMVSHAGVLSRILHIAGAEPRVVRGFERIWPNADIFERRLTIGHLEWESGLVASIRDGVGWDVQQGDSELVVTGTEGVLRTFERKNVVREHAKGTEVVAFSAYPGLFAADVATFLNGVFAGISTNGSAEHEVRVLQTADRMRESV